MSGRRKRDVVPQRPHRNSGGTAVGQALASSRFAARAVDEICNFASRCICEQSARRRGLQSTQGKNQRIVLSWKNSKWLIEVVSEKPFQPGCPFMVHRTIYWQQTGWREAHRHIVQIWAAPTHQQPTSEARPSAAGGASWPKRRPKRRCGRSCPIIASIDPCRTGGFRPQRGGRHAQCAPRLTASRPHGHNAPRESETRFPAALCKRPPH